MTNPMWNVVFNSEDRSGTPKTAMQLAYENAKKLDKPKVVTPAQLAKLQPKKPTVSGHTGSAGHYNIGDTAYHKMFGRCTITHIDYDSARYHYGIRCDDGTITRCGKRYDLSDTPDQYRANMDSMKGRKF